MKKRILAVLLAILMFVCLLSMTAFAAEGDPTVTAIADLVYNGQSQELVSADVPEGYTMYYAMNKSPLSTNDAGWGTDVPTARDAGTYTVWYYAKDADGKDTEISEGIDVTISPMELPDGALTAKVSNPPVYNGMALEPTPSVSVKVSGKSYNVKPGDYTVEYANNVNAGDNASVTVKAAEGGNYIFKDVTVSFSIGKATVRVPQYSIVLTETSRVYDPADYTAGVKIAAAEGYVTVKGVSGQHLIVKSVSGSVKYNSAGSQTVTLAADEVDYVDGADPANYNEVQFADRPTLTIDKAEITSYEAPTAIEGLVAGTKQQLVNAGSTPDGTMLYRLKDDTTWKNSANAVTGNEAKTYVVEYYIKGDQNHLDLGSEDEPLGSVEVTIVEAQGSMLSGGSIAIVVVIAVIAIGAVVGIAVSKKKRSAN